MQTQSSSHKDSPRSKKPKPKDSKPDSSRDNVAKPAKKEDRKEKKKKLRNQKKKHTGKQIPATRVNTKASKKKIIARYFNCNKKGHYANECTKPPKN